MKRPMAIVILSGLLALIPLLSVDADAPLRLHIDDSGKLALVDVVQTTTERGLAIKGVVVKRGMERGKIRGDVDVELLNRDGKTIAMREGVLVGFGSSPRNPDYAHFSVEFASLPPDAMAIRVRHHR